MTWQFSPDDSPVCLTQVDLSAFSKITAKIDRIDFRCDLSDVTAASLRGLRRNLSGGTLVAPKGWRVMQAGGPILAIHDPSIKDLQYLIDRFYDAVVLHFEVAVDFKLMAGANDRSPLKNLKAQFRHAAHPQKHAQLKQSNRKYYCLARRRYMNDGLGTPLPDGQIIWETADTSDQVGLYIKETDAHLTIGDPWVRFEARLKDSGPRVAGLGRLGMLPAFAPKLRKHFADMFFVANGFKNNVAIAKGQGVPQYPWPKWGAQWTARGKARLAPDSEVNRKIGLALNNLRTSLLQLQPPPAVAHRFDAWIAEYEQQWMVATH